MKKTTTYFLYGLALIISFTLLYLGLSYLWDQVTYAHESQQLQEAIISTDTQIKSNSDKRNQIDEQIKQLTVDIQTLRQEQANLKTDNDKLRQTLSQQKDSYQDFLGFNSGR